MSPTNIQGPFDRDSDDSGYFTAVDADTLRPIAAWLNEEGNGAWFYTEENPVIDSAGESAQTPSSTQTPVHAMTAEQFAAARPDLALNWNRAHDPAWVAQNPTAGAIVGYINSFPAFIDYLRHEYQASVGEDFSAPIPATAQPSTPAPGAIQNRGAPQKADARHVFVGQTASTDRWQLYDGPPFTGNDRVLEWDVAPGAPSTAMIAGTLHDLGPPSSATVAQRPAKVVTTPAGTVVTNPPGGNVVTVPGPGGGGPPNTNTGGSITPPKVTRILHPVTGWPIDVLDAWHRVGDDTAGNPVFQLVDAGGQVKQFTIDGRGDVKNLINAPTYGVMVGTTPPPSAPATNPPPVNSPPGSLIPGGNNGTGTGPTFGALGLLLLAAAAWAAMSN